MYGISFLLAPEVLVLFFNTHDLANEQPGRKTSSSNVFKHSGNKLSFILENIPSLELTVSLHMKMDGWKMKCPVGKASFCGAMLVSWRVISFQFAIMCPLRMYSVTTYRYSISGEEKPSWIDNFEKTPKKTTQRANQKNLCSPTCLSFCLAANIRLLHHITSKIKGAIKSSPRSQE